MNRLGAETSPYLLQHADNPVDWYPWGPEALERAREEDRPILLSVGYSACHWCHVMAHESFENEATACADERAFRQRQGRSRGAARRRRALHGRDRVDDRSGRLADDGLPDARRGSRSTPAPTSRRSRGTECRRSRNSCSPWPRPGRTQRDDIAAQARRLVEAVGNSARIAAVARAAHGCAAARGGTWHRANLRAGVRRLRPCAEVSAGIESRVPAATRLTGGDRDGSQRRSTAWRRAGCTTSSAAASIATRSTTAGSSRISRRCSTTTRSSPVATCMRGS